MNFYIADTHFFHKNIVKYCNRPFADVEEMNETLVANWNRKVRERDSVYILGDFAFCSGEMANELLDRLNGKKYLIRGNHDSFLGYSAFETSKFEWIKDYAKISDHNRTIVLFHYPIASWEKKHHGAIHLHGHTHNGEKPLVEGLIYNVGVDVTDFKPITMKEILKEFEKMGMMMQTDVQIISEN